MGRKGGTVSDGCAGRICLRSVAVRQEKERSGRKRGFLLFFVPSGTEKPGRAALTLLPPRLMMTESGGGPVKRWFLALILCLLAATECLASAVQVRRFDVVIDVAGNGDIVVEETLDVDIPESGRFHGIFRDIPVVTLRHGQGRASMEVLAVRLDGRPLPADDVSRSPSSVRVYQRDRERLLEPGRHEFFLSYRMTGQTAFFEANDELTWNVTGSSWERPIDGASCTVRCPAGAPFFGQRAWLGRPGSRESSVTMRHAVENGRLVMRFTAQRSVKPGEDFTVAAGWGKGFIVPEKAAGSLPGALLFGILDAALLLYFFLVWFFTGRDPKKGVVVPRFHPPHIRRGTDGRKGALQILSPAATAFLYHKTEVTPGCFGAAVLSLVMQGCCSLEGGRKEGFVLKRGEGLSPHAEENRILELLEGELPVDREHGERLAAMRRAMGKQLRSDYGKLWKGAGGGLTGLFGSVWMFIGMAATLLALAAVTGYLTGGVLPEGTPGVIVPVLFLFFLFRRFLPVSASLRRSGRWGPFVVSLLFQACAFAFMGFFIFTICRDTFDMFTPAETGLAFFALFIPLFFSCIMDAPTQEARAVLDEIEGLALYMRMAEVPVMNAQPVPGRTPQHYHELLPYAVALGLEQAWGAHFSAGLFTASSAGGEVMTPERAGAFSSCAERSASSAGSGESSSSSARRRWRLSAGTGGKAFAHPTVLA